MISRTELVLGGLRYYARIAPSERGGYRLVRAARRFIPKSAWKGSFRTDEGLQLELDLDVYPDCCMAAGLYELDTLRQIKRVLCPGAWFVDCGANIGYFTMIAARLVGAEGRVDAFEPDPFNLRRLERNLSVNGLQRNVKVHPLAVSNSEGELTLYRPRAGIGNHGMASVFPGSAGDGEAVKIHGVRLDEFISEDVPDLIKIDIEGGELSAIEGMKQLLSRRKPPILIFEYNPASYKAAGYRGEELFVMLAKMQPLYRLFWIGRRLREIGSPESMQAIKRQGNILAQAV